MAGPDWLRWLLTALFLGVAGYCVARLVAARSAGSTYGGCHRAVDVGNVLMGVGMAAMSSPIGGPLPHAGWQAVFLLLAVWFAVSRLTGADPVGWHGGSLHHAIGAAAMLYMLIAIPHGGADMAQPWMAGTVAGTAALPVVAWVLAGYFALHALRTGVAVSRVGGAPVAVHSPRLAMTCQLVMSLGATAMLLTVA